DFRFRGLRRELVTKNLIEPQMAADDHARHVEIVEDWDGIFVAAIERQHVPERMTIVAPVRVAREEADAPIEVADQRLGECETGGITARKSRLRGSELVFGELPARAVSRHCLTVVLDEQGIANERSRRAIGFPLFRRACDAEV